MKKDDLLSLKSRGNIYPRSLYNGNGEFDDETRYYEFGHLTRYSTRPPYLPFHLRKEHFGLGICPTFFPFSPIV